MTSTQEMTSFGKREPACDGHSKRSYTTGGVTDFYTTQYASKYNNRPADKSARNNGPVSNERHVLSNTRALPLVDNLPLDDSCPGNYCSVTSNDFQPYTYRSSWNKLPLPFHPAPSSFNKNTIYEPIKGSSHQKSTTQQDYPKRPVPRGAQALEFQRKPPTGVIDSRSFFEMLSDGSIRSTGVSLTKTDFLPFQFERNLTPDIFPYMTDKNIQNSNRTTNILAPPPSKNNAAVEMAHVVNRDPTDVWSKQEPVKQSVYDCSYKMPPIGETVKEHEMHVRQRKHVEASARNNGLKFFDVDNPEKFVTHYTRNYPQKFDRTNNPSLPYLVNEHCRVDADFV